MKILHLAVLAALILFASPHAAHALKAPPGGSSSRTMSFPNAAQKGYGNNDSKYTAKDQRNVRRKSIENRRNRNNRNDVQPAADDRTASQKKLTEPPQKSGRRKAAQAKRQRGAQTAPSNTASAGVND